MCLSEDLFMFKFLSSLGFMDLDILSLSLSLYFSAYVYNKMQYL